MKKAVILLSLVSIFTISYSQNKDTIAYGNGGYLYPATDYSNFSLLQLNYLQFSGNVYSPDADKRVIGISCITDTILGGGVTLILAKYIGPDSILSDSIIQTTVNFNNTIPTLTIPYPRDTYYQIIDSVRIYPGTEPTRHIMLNNYGVMQPYKIFDAFFDSVQIISDSSIYFVIFKHYPNFNAISHDLSIRWISKISVFFTQNEKYYVTNHRYEDLEHNYNTDDIDSFYSNPTPMLLRAHELYYGIFPIIDSLYNLEIHHSCPPPPKPTVYVNRRHALFVWNNNSSHCAYELALGYADQDYNTYSSIITTANSCSTETLALFEKYACRLRALCCSSEGDSIWSAWSDTVQFYRPTYRVSTRSNNIHFGYVLGAQEAEIGDTVKLTAYPRYDKVRFVYWSSGDTINPLYVVAHSDTTIVAYFELSNDSSLNFSITDNVGIDIRPNPADNVVNIHSTNPIINIKIIDIRGQEMLNLKTQNTFDTTINLNSIQSGCYFLKILTNQNYTIRKLIVRKQ